MSDHARKTAPMLASPRCGAKTRPGRACRSPAVRGKQRCRMSLGESCLSLGPPPNRWTKRACGQRNSLEIRSRAARAALAKRCVRCSISSGYESLAIRIPIRYVLLMIRSFKGKFAEPILQGRMIPKGFPANLAKVARRKLIMVDSAGFLEALNSPPGNRLEALKGDLAGKHSIRINDQWRVVFRWTDAGPEDVEICDYH
jgi:toxin HigB-1